MADPREDRQPLGQMVGGLDRHARSRSGTLVRRAAIAYGVAVLLANRYFGLARAAVAVAVCLVVQFAVVEPAERRRRRRHAVFAAVADALPAESDVPDGGRFACPCCGYLTPTAAPPGTYIICDVCFWEDDRVQFRDPDYEGGSNTVSLNQARANFQTHGVSELQFKLHVRDPLPEEQS